MTPVGAALVLVGLAVLVWPIGSPAERRLSRLQVSRRVAAVSPTAPGMGLWRHPPGGSGDGSAGRARRSPRRVAAAVAVGAAGAVATLAAGPALGVAAAAAAGAGAVVVGSALAARERARCRADLGTALGVLRGELEAGAVFGDAVRAARARAGTAVAVFDADAPAARDAGRPSGGDPERELVDGAGPAGPAGPADPADPVVRARRSIAAGAALVAVTGAPWAGVVAGIARDVAAHDAREREVAAALAGARASTVVLALLPVLGLGLAAALGGDPVGFLVYSAGGRVALAAGAVLDLAGVVVSAGIATRVTR